VTLPTIRVRLGRFQVARPEERDATILVIDDNEQNRALLEDALEGENYRVVLVSSGEEGVERFAERTPDCVLLDVNMPGMNGFDTCRKLRALPDGGSIPIVFLTAQRDVSTFERAIDAGGDDFLTKPINLAELSVRIRSALKLSRMSAELREHYDLIRRQRDDLMRLQLQKERLTAFVVHDLKNPVNAIDLQAQVLSRKKDLPETARATVTHIRDEVRSLMRLILNLLDISKSETGALRPTVGEVDLEELAGVVLEALGVRAETHGVRLASKVHALEIRADEDLLRRVVENLLDNAIKHAPEGSEVRLTTHAVEGGVEIRVSDEGRGVPAEMRDRVFEQFVQLESAGQSRTGRGLGLAFCKLAIEAHGGRVWLEEGNPGAVFCIRLPRTEQR
jgi:two-component system sensor histidine kinase/response regulator